MLLFIDNFDSFTYNLVHCFEELGADVHVVRHQALSVQQCIDLHPSHIVLGPGPGTPRDAGISCELIRACMGRIPLLGVCLGHQCIGEVFGAKVCRAQRAIHGKVSSITHESTGLFNGLSPGFQATRYHSLVIDPTTLPEEIAAVAWTDEGEVMGIQHKNWPLFGVQFHPESVLSYEGPKLLQNFVYQT